MTLLLSKDAYENARRFLLTRGRKLEAALFLHEFEQGDAEEVYKELATFRNEDGGFGNALEPDIRCAASSALATTTAMQTLLKITERNEEMIEGAMRYFLSTYDESRHGWDIIPQEAEQFPRAIWWEYGAFLDHWGNPNAEIVGYFNQIPSVECTELAATLNSYVTEQLREVSDLNEMHEMACYLRWAETLPEDSRKAIGGKLDEFVNNCVIKNPADRQGYGGYPLLIVDSPVSRYYPWYSEVIPGDLDSLIESQGEDGAWSPNWAWGRFEETWEKARVEWQGILTLKALRTLRSFGRL
ncbi:hypothetical protein [Cohnella luojiensis]|uniref:Uncharacterized protein n=1 Tax=Cohnella luojiensis TaxID=652876 RepID=A0A4Y8LYC1_9BACL|nr:hypothetical protein [Cohnella luojiensis]TFE27252.1 hypothetical protein E2980_10170 [Cohnella luojiensis]